MSIFISIRLFKGRNMTSSSFSTSAKVEIGANSKQKLPVKLIFSAQNAILGENFSRAEEKNIPKKVVFAPKVAEWDEKGRFWEEIAGRG